MTTLRLLTAIYLLCITIPSVSQDFEVPANYSLVAKEDYAPYEKDVIAASKWLQAVPSNELVEKRKEVKKFVVKWINGSPNVDVFLYSVNADISKKNPDLLIVYMAAAAQFVLEGGAKDDRTGQATYAFQAISKVYWAGKGVTKDKKMDKLVKSVEEGKLAEWINANLK